MSMANNILGITRYLISIFVMILFVSSNCYAEVYKWVDANGHTHYSDKKVDAGQSKVESLDVKPLLNLIPKVSTPNPNAKESVSSQSRPRNQDIQQEKTQTKSKHSANSRGQKNDHVDYRCNLARRVISGEAKLVNGEPTGEHEIMVAKRDIRKFCN